MPSENKTPNYGLNQWQGNEYPKRVDFNEDNAIIDEALTPSADPSQAPTGNGPGKLSSWVSWFANRIKTITGKTNWWEAPVKTLQEIWDELAAHQADMASQAVGKGAWMICSSDVGNYFASHNVEGILQEIGLYIKRNTPFEMSWSSNLTGCIFKVFDVTLSQGAFSAAQIDIKGNLGSSTPQNVNNIIMTVAARGVSIGDKVEVVSLVDTPEQHKCKLYKYHDTVMVQDTVMGRYAYYVVFDAS